ncbi:hypothetical protein OQA88_10611 [Cercophora sp. LCS_1]
MFNGRRPIAPGEDTRGMCVYNYHAVIMTDDKSACEAVIGPGTGTYNIPMGWVRATWLNSEIWFPPGRCFDNYDQWYNGETSALKRSWNDIYENVTAVANGDYNQVGLKYLSWYNGLVFKFYGCTSIAGLAKRATTISATSSVASNSVLFAYYGIFFQRNDDGSIDWKQPSETPGNVDRRWYCMQARMTPEGYYFQSGVALMTLSTPFHTSTSTTAMVITSEATPTPSITESTDLPSTGASTGASTPVATSEVETEQSSAEPTQASSLVTAIDQTSLMASPVTTPPTESGPTSWTFVNIPVLTSVYTSFTTTQNGTLRTIFTPVPTSQTVMIQLPAVMLPMTTYTTTDSLGSSTTITTVPGIAILRTVVTMSTDSLGSVSTYTTAIPATSVVATLTNAKGVATATVTTFPVFPKIPGSSPADITLPSSSLTYLTVYFLPLILTILLLIPLQSLDAEIKLLLPFRSLSRIGGSDHAMTMKTSGLYGVWNSFLLLIKEKDPLSLVSDTLMLAAAILVSLSGETVGLKLRGNCIKRNLNTCFITLAVFRTPARIAQALLALLAIGVAVVWWCMKQPTGVATHPGSMAGLCVLLQGREVKDAVKNARGDAEKKAEGRLEKQMKGKRFFLGGFDGAVEEYGICQVDAGQPLGVKLKRAAPLMERGVEEGRWLRVGTKERSAQSAFLVLLMGLLAVILYYENVVWEDPTMSAFETFMDSQSFGVNFLFTGLGVVIQFVWEDFCNDFFMMNTYRRMALKPQDARYSVLEERATNVFTGLWRALRQREPLAGAMAFAALLSKFLPLFLSGVPFATAQTFYAHEVCTWGSVVLLCVMIVILVLHMWLVKWPHMPVSIETLAGRIYYVCDSTMLADFARLSMLDRRERDLRVQRMGRKYRFGWVTGLSGERRVAADYAEGETGYQLKTLGTKGFGVGGEIKGK